MVMHGLQAPEKWQERSCTYMDSLTFSYKQYRHDDTLKKLSERRCKCVDCLIFFMNNTNANAMNNYARRAVQTDEQFQIGKDLKNAVMKKKNKRNCRQLGYKQKLGPSKSRALMPCRKIIFDLFQIYELCTSTNLFI